MSKSSPAGSVLQPEIQIFHQGDDFFQSSLEAFRSARHEILIESYIFELDPIGESFLVELRAAVRRGVHVYILVDGIGSLNFIGSLPNDAEFQRLHFRIYHPLPFQERWSWARLQKYFFLLQKINKRNHRKMILVDDAVVFLGSCNISKVHSRKFSGAQAWRDTHLRFQFSPGDPEIQFLKKAFFEAWRNARRPNPLRLARQLQKPGYWKRSESRYFKLNSRIHWRFTNLHDLNRRILQATKSVRITNPYFVPQRSLFHALITAAQRGVEVCLCLPKKSDVWVVQQASRALYSRLLKEGVRIYEYEPSILHAKTLVIDQDWATVGSHNLNHRSFFHDLEVQAVFTSSECIQNLLNQWQIDLQNSRPVQLDDLNKVTFLNRIISTIIYWFRYWL